MKNRQHNISIFQSGVQSKQPVIFVHGFPFDHYMWDSIVKGISENYFCTTYDIRGLGSSPAGDGQFTIELFCDDLFSIIEELNLKDPVLCGLSMGGYISLRAVERNEKKFKALILCDTKSEPDNNQAKLKRAQGINIINNKNLRAFINEFLPTCFAEDSIKKMGKEYTDVYDRALRHDPAGVKGCLLAMAGRTDTTEYLSRIQIPVLILCGEMDTLSPPPVMKAMAEKIKNCRFEVIRGSGHMTPLENPRAVLQHMRSFLKELNKS